ncbi:MAG: S-methyl-5-thioribose-1-phosphate isomerase [Candidatus Omnitrophica bacterium]|jgi:methylthioribose-1-phosphate isomerase|nr:S-methyl-5-thioribose-1-phosphate isomerase [Candidatus Omnitrophota bacterium]
MYSIQFKNNQLFYLDQSKLPSREVWLKCRNLKQGYQAIKSLAVRGAPLIGVFAAYCIVVHLKNLPLKKKAFFKAFSKALSYLKSCRPTAVNLSWSLKRLAAKAYSNKDKNLSQIKLAITSEAEAIHKEDILLCQKMADYGYKLIKRKDNILTHCNSGFLATSGEGTALGVIYKAAQVYKDIRVYVDETRPLLQGSRLSAWELTKKKIPVTIICDSTAAYLMRHKKIDKIFVGADRIAANGDVANKIGTCNLAVIARYHRIPFYVVAPFSSFDLSLRSGKDIPIEERNPEEVRKILAKVYLAPKTISVRNPAFDITPHKLVTAIVSDKGIIYPPFAKNIKKILK